MPIARRWPGTPSAASTWWCSTTTPTGTSTRGDIYGRRVGADGQRLGEQFRITGLYTPGNEASPAIAWNATTNQYLVVWVDDRVFPARGYDIRGPHPRRIGRRASVPLGSRGLPEDAAAETSHGPAARPRRGSRLPTEGLRTVAIDVRLRPIGGL